MENHRKKGYYFSQIDKGGVGPRKKVLSQIKAFEKCGIDLELVESPFQLEGKIRGNFLLRQVICRLPFTYVYSRHRYEEKYKDADVFYIRFLAGDFYFSQFIKKLKKKNPNSKIVMELADYPTTWYMTTSLLYKIVYTPIILKDILARRYYKKYVDRIALLKPLDKVYGIPAIQFVNGIDVDSIQVRRPSGIDTIRLIAVAAMCNFHGYDRLIEGLHQYYTKGGTRRIEIHFVGGRDAPGNELMRYKALCEQYQLHEYITFYGEKTGRELDEIYDRCNLAVASLGMYRIGYKTANSLKIREYVAKGIPIISGCMIDIFEGREFSYVCEMPNDDSAINIEKIIYFFDQVYQLEEEKVISEIRSFAERYCDMFFAMRNIIDFFKE